MIKQVPGDKRKRSQFSTFQNFVNPLYSRTALLLKSTHSLRKKVGDQLFLRIVFVSGLITKIHINFKDDNVFETLVSTRKV